MLITERTKPFGITSWIHMIIIANILVSIIAANHLLFAYKEFSGRNKADFYNKFEIKIADGQDLAQIGRIVTNAAIFNALIALGLIVSLVWSGDQGMLPKKYLLFSIIVAGAAGGLTLKPIVAWLQSVPAVIALALVLLAQ
jgi:putative membrane protein